jgi:hypothetical protein
MFSGMPFRTAKFASTDGQSSTLSKLMGMLVNFPEYMDILWFFLLNTIWSIF